MKNLCLASIMYAGDNNDRLPDSRIWMALTSVYFNNKANYRCPAVAKGQYGYAFMDKLSRLGQDKIASPSGTLMVIDSKDTRWNAHGDISLLPDPPRHSNGNTIGFADGHADRLNDFKLKHLRRQ